MNKTNRIYKAINSDPRYYALDNIHPLDKAPHILNFDQLENVVPNKVWHYLDNSDDINFFLEEYLSL